ncbi:MAG: pyridoxal phosphate-dependent aminotransferase [Candidatus Aminicenantes bacterium]|jgi:aspartate/methionine/tyrosine aminotransferase
MNTTTQKTPLLEIAESSMPDGIRQTISSEPIIPAIAAKAKVIAQKNPAFIRSDQGQILDIFPDREIYYGPSAGLEELRELLGRFWTLTYRLKGIPGILQEGLGKKNVAIVTGATEGLSIVMHLIANRQNVGLLPLYWSNYRGVILNAGGHPIILNFFDENYNPDFDKIQSQIEEHKITSLLINFPTNPSGDVLTEDEMGQLADLARRLNLILLSDEVYGTLRYKGEPQSMLAYAPERTVIISSASKEYLIPGARIGYVLAADETFTNSWMSKMIRSFSSSPNVMGQQMLIDILKEEVSDLEKGEPPRINTQIKDELRKRCALVIEVLEEKGFDLAGRDSDFPSGAISVLARLPEDIAVDDKEFVERALDMGKFSAVPASVFGAPGCIRIGYAGMTEDKIRNFAGALQDVLDFFRRG